MSKRIWFFLGMKDHPKSTGPPPIRPGYLSQYVTVDQMRSKGNGEVKAHPTLLARLDALASFLGAPIPILSGYRDPDHNALIGGAPNSQHTYGTAVDISQDYRFSIALAENLGFSGIGSIEGTDIVVHVDTRAEGPNNTTGATIKNPTYWTYPA